MRVIFALTLIVSLALAALVASVAAGQSGDAPAYRIIVHPHNPVTRLERQFLADAFLKKVTRWSDDRVVYPADLFPNAPARVAFSKEVLRRSVAAVKAYWQQRIFSGRGVPPPEFVDESSVVAYVLKYEGAIGYVSATTDVEGAKEVTVSW